MAEAGTSASAVSLPQLQAADEMFTQALALKKKDPDAAIELLAHVVEARALHYGAGAPECGDALFLYGKLLFERSLACQDALGGVPKAQYQEVTQPDQARENMDPNAPPGQRPNPRGPNTGAVQRPLAPLGATEADDDEEDQEEEEEEEEEEENREEDGDGIDDAAEDSDDGEEGDDDGDEDEDQELEGDDMGQAWQALELARVIFSASPEEHRVMLSEIHLTLGDIKAEQEQFQDASCEYQKCLQLLEAIQPPNRRRLAEAHFQHASALGFLDDLPAAKQSCDTALELLKAQNAELESQLDSLAEQPEAGSQLQDIAAEVKELEVAIKDVQEKVEEFDALIQTRASFRNPLRTAWEAALESLPKVDNPAAPEPSNAAATVPEAGASTKPVQAKRRITAVPVAAKRPAPGFGPAPTETGIQPAPKKRTLEDLMSGGGAGETVIGFGAAARSDGEALDPVKKPRPEL